MACTFDSSIKQNRNPRYRQAETGLEAARGTYNTSGGLLVDANGEQHTVQETADNASDAIDNNLVLKPKLGISSTFHFEA